MMASRDSLISMYRSRVSLIDSSCRLQTITNLEVSFSHIIMIFKEIMGVEDINEEEKK
jgi:hypothetical protein